MKNIHVLPTDKPSRLIIYSTLLNEFRLLDEPIEDWKHKKNIYITSDEKFVRDEYITDGIEVMKATPKLVDAQGLVDRRDWKKILMTTDPELINDGVHPIGDEFLEWFVKNPSCEEVEIEESYSMSQLSYSGIEYEIIIPKKNFYCGDEVDYGEQCSFQCENCVDATGVDYGYLPNGKEEQKQHLIDIMKSDEELGLYSESGVKEIKFEDVFNDEKREGVKRVIHQHKVLKGLSLVNPAHLQMTSNGHGEFPDGYKLTEKGIQYIIEQLNKE